MGPLEIFLRRLFGIDPGLSDVSARTERLAATMNGDTRWMLTCRPKIEQEIIECDDDNTYKRVKNGS